MKGVRVNEEQKRTILELIERGERVATIAEELDLSEQTIRNHLPDTRRRGHKFENNGRWREDIDTKEVRRLRAKGTSLRQIARMYRTTASTLSDRLKADEQRAKGVPTRGTRRSG